VNYFTKPNWRRRLERVVGPGIAVATGYEALAVGGRYDGFMILERGKETLTHLLL